MINQDVGNVGTSRFQKAASASVCGVSGSVGAKEGQLVAVLCHAADLVHLHPMAQLGQNSPVLLLQNYGTNLYSSLAPLLAKNRLSLELHHKFVNLRTLRAACKI